MAHAGTPTGLAQQPAASSSLWKSLFGLVVILAIGIAMVIAVPVITGGRATTAPAVDRSYDQIENARGAATLSGVTSSNAVEKAAAAKARAMSGVPVDNSTTSVENARAKALSGTTIDPTTFDRTPRGAHGQLP